MVAVVTLIKIWLYKYQKITAEGIIKMIFILYGVNINKLIHIIIAFIAFKFFNTKNNKRLNETTHSLLWVNLKMIRFGNLVIS